MHTKVSSRGHFLNHTPKSEYRWQGLQFRIETKKT
jgi:hypothetical protein